jgi:hypothetical protein
VKPTEIFEYSIASALTLVLVGIISGDIIVSEDIIEILSISAWIYVGLKVSWILSPTLKDPFDPELSALEEIIRAIMSFALMMFSGGFLGVVLMDRLLVSGGWILVVIVLLVAIFFFFTTIKKGKRRKSVR